MDATPTAASSATVIAPARQTATSAHAYAAPMSSTYPVTSASTSRPA